MFLEKFPYVEISYEKFREHYVINYNISILLDIHTLIIVVLVMLRKQIQVKPSNTTVLKEVKKLDNSRNHCEWK